jgi:hypothetical protein
MSLYYSPIIKGQTEKTCSWFQSEDLFFVLGQGDDSRAFGLQPVMKKQHSSETLFCFSSLQLETDLHSLKQLLDARSRAKASRDDGIGS